MRVLSGELRTLDVLHQGVRYERSYWSGEAWQLGTAAFWEDVAVQTRPAESPRRGHTLLEEVAACILGGHGVSAAMSEAAFTTLRAGGLLAGRSVTSAEVSSALQSSLESAGYKGRYRFPRQRGAAIARAIDYLLTRPAPAEGELLRDYLMGIAGIGYKTASWVVRNHLSSDCVAVVDIHLVRAGLSAGIFDEKWRLPRDYLLYERFFLKWAEQAAVSAVHLDACIWGLLSGLGPQGRDILGVPSLSERPRPAWSTASASAFVCP